MGFPPYLVVSKRERLTKSDLLRVSKFHTWPAAVSIDELDAGGRIARFGSQADIIRGVTDFRFSAESGHAGQD